MLARTAPALIASAALLLVPARPSAAPSDRSWALDLGGATSVPILVGAQLTLELPLRLLAQAEAGWLPGPYVDLINEVAVALDAYGETTARLIESGLQDSAVLRLSAGWRPIPGWGLELLGGYTYAFLGGGASPTDLLEAVLARDVPLELGPEVEFQSVIHAFHVSVGWRWVLAEHLVLRASAGYLQVFDSSSRVELPSSGPALRDAVERLNDDLDAYMDGVYTDYVKAPLLGLSLALRL